MDISTSITSEGKIRLHRDRGQQLPPGWILNGNGEPSCNPTDFYAKPRGTILPLGGPAGYKGFSLATMVEILAGTLSGQCITTQGEEHNSLWLLAINIETTLALSSFKESLSVMTDYMKSSALAANSTGVRLPGEIEFATVRLRREQGIEIHDANWQEISRLARALNVEV
jgi:LDH2 family malate/lactate/ureidoglycolate dehydrogenase